LLVPAAGLSYRLRDQPLSDPGRYCDHAISRLTAVNRDPVPRALMCYTRRPSRPIQNGKKGMLK
ncbi:MAG TPA: hypothetical protein VKI41_03555, partial [Vicinamibacteria bacterium]|nr:hypothetical protein [Vicinamibacteria bacterium]